VARYKKTDAYKESQHRHNTSDAGKKSNKKYRDSVKGKLNSIKGRARKGGIDFSLNLNDVERIEKSSNVCAYCGTDISTIVSVIEFSHIYNGDNTVIIKIKKALKSGINRTKKLTFDRINSFEGYNSENVVLCCSLCNQAKGWIIPGDMYAEIAPAVIANIVNICKEAGLVLQE